MFFNFAHPINNIQKEQTPEDIYNSYVGDCIMRECDPTLSGLALAFGYDSIDELKKACNEKETAYLRKYVLKVHQSYEENLTKKGGSVGGATFALKSMFGWQDTQNIKIEQELSVDQLKEKSTEELLAMLGKDEWLHQNK